MKPKPKTVVCDLLGFRQGVSVRRGRGTAWNWIYITTPKKVSIILQDAIEIVLIRLGLVGIYMSDQPGDNTRNPNVSWETRE